MRAVLMVLVLVFTYFMAGLYQSAPMAVLSGAELAVMLVLSLLPGYFRRTVRVSFTDRLTESVRGGDAVCRLRARCGGLLPAGRLELRLAVHTPGERRVLRRKLYGGADRGETPMEFRLHTPYCGLLLLRLEQVRCFDYLNLFSRARKTEEALRVAVYPGEETLRLDLPGGGGTAGTPRNASEIPGEGSDEIRKLREYQPGDPVRRVHWNLSARTDTLWIKEWERDAESRIVLVLDGAPPEKPEEYDAWYRLLSALLLGLLEVPAAARVHWQRGGKPCGLEVGEREQVRELLLTLYQAPPDARPERAFPAAEPVLRLTPELEVQFDGGTCFRFSPETLDRELKTTFS